MGGPGSGRHWHFGQKPLTTEMRRLDVRRWARAGMLRPGHNFGWQWSMDGEVTASIRAEVGEASVTLDYRVREYSEDWEPMRYTIPLLSQQIPNGGHRRWFLCPARGCGRRAAILYGGRVFACRHCHGLAYPTQREGRFGRALARRDKLVSKLGWDNPHYGCRPKGMHHRTFARLIAELDVTEAIADDCTVKLLRRLGADF